MRRAALLVSLVLVATSCRARDDTTWRFAIEETSGGVQDAYAQKFAELIAAKSGGEIEVIVYPYGALGTSDQTTELLYDGSIQFAMASPGHIGKLLPEVQVFLLHYIFSGDADVDARALADPTLRETLDAIYREKNFVLMSVFTEGAMVWTTKKEIREPSDFEGVKIRTMTSPMLLADYEAYGASPTPLPFGEVYSSLQLNMIDGQVNPLFAIHQMSFHRVTSHLVFPDHAQFVATAMSNAEFYDGLPAEKRRWIDEAVAEIEPHVLAFQKELNATTLDEILQDKPSLEVVRLTEEEKAAFREAARSVHRTFTSQVGERGQLVLDQLLDAVDRARASGD